MKLERFVSKGCCGGKQIAFKLDRPIQRDLLDFLISNGFEEAEHFTKVGMVYLTNQTFILTGPLGADRISVKCKKGDCDDQTLQDLEGLLTKME